MKRRTIKKQIAFLTAMTMLAGTLGVPGIEASVSKAAETVTPIAEFTFDDASGSGEITGTGAKASGTYTIVDSFSGGGKALHLNGNGQHVALTKPDGSSLLSGLDEVTISYEAKHERTDTNWTFYAAPNANAQTYGQEHYIGAFQNGGVLKVERYNNSGSRPGAAEAATGNDWAHVTVVYSADATVVYVNGKETARYGITTKLTDILGNNSVFYIGRANWGTGEYCQAAIDNFRVYDKAFTEEQVALDYANYAFAGDAQVLTIPAATNRNLTLPAKGASGLTTITWESSNSAVLANNGTVSRGASDVDVKLTASISANGKTTTKEFTVKVLKKDVDADLAGYQTELTLNAGYIAEDLALPSKIGDASVTWNTSDAAVITANGKITRAAKENKTATLTATITTEGKHVTKAFPLTVLAEGKNIVSYVSNAPATGQNGGMKVALEGTNGYKAIHENQPILYTAQGGRAFGATVLFRKADGTFGAVAADGGNSGTVFVYDSETLAAYTGERTVTLTGIANIADLECVYDSADKVYKLFIQDKSGNAYVSTSTDLRSFSEAQLTDYTFETIKGVPSDAVSYAALALTNAEYDALNEHFGHPYNTNVDLSKIKDIEIEKGGNYTLEDTVQAEYSNGETRTLGIRWNEADLARVDTSRPGEYTIKGVVGGNSNRIDADSPLVPERADPFVTYNETDGYYYFTASYPMNGYGDADGYDRLILRRARTLNGLADAEEVTIWDENSVNGYGRWIWAPELHKIGGYWYYISTAAVNENDKSFDIRPFMLRCNNEADMMNPASWGNLERVKAMAGDEANCVNAMSLDMTYFEAGGRHYLVWADFTRNSGNPSGISSLYIATIDPSNPTQLTSPCSVITLPEYSWERVGPWVNEGPAVIKKNGKVYLAFSASGTGMEYCVGVLTGDATADLTKKENWVKTNYPIMTSTDFNDEVSGPGHNSFTVDEYGNPVIVYHARPTHTHTTAGGVHNGDPLYDPCRHCYLKQVFFTEDGMPILNMTEDELVADKYRNVEVTLTVKGEAVEAKPVLEYNFDETFTKGTAKDSAGKNDAVLSDGAEYVKDDKYGQVLYLDGGTDLGGNNSFLSFPEGFFDGKDSVTISMDVNEVTRTGNYFTFTVGQDNQKYLFLKTDPTHLKLAITTSSFQNEKIAEKNFVHPNNSRRWINVKMVVTPTTISLYQDGELIAENLSTGVKLSDLGTNLKAYLGRSFYSGDKYFRGYFDNVKVYDYAMSDGEIWSVTQQEAKARREAMGNVKYVSDEFAIPNADNIKGNITLPSEINGVKVAWKSSDEKVISTEAVKNAGYDDTPAGVVTRQDKDTKVTLTATFSRNGETSVTKDYPVTVKAKVKAVTDEDYVGYLFVRFTGTEEDVTKEQTYFSISEDGLNWKDLNNNKAVLSSTFGESGLRDHYIARSPEGDKYYMIATDLSIATNITNATWPEAGSNGSHSIVVWESDDLVNWSEPWLAEIAPENAGCTWAPEFIYDNVTGEYIVYWSATSVKLNAAGTIAQEYENHAIYYSKTRDFRTFTDAKLYHEGEMQANGYPVKVIDSTMIYNDGTYYRYTKNESNGTIMIDKSDKVLGEYTDIASPTLSTSLPAAQGAVEGPIIFKMNEKTADGKTQWCLMVDRFARGQGYYPLITTDLESGEFRMLNNNEFSFPNKFRHGYVMPVTAKEYGALQRAYGDGSYVDNPLELIASYDMTAKDGKLVDTTGNGHDAAYVGFTNADFRTEEKDAVLVFDGSKEKYVALPAGLIETEAFAVEATFKTNTVANSWLWCLGAKEGAWPNVNNYVFVSPKFEGDVLRAGIKDAANEQLFANAGSIANDTYTTVRVEFTDGNMRLLVDGNEISTLETGYSIQEILENGTADDICGYIGKSLYTVDAAFTGTLTQFDVYAEKGEKPVDPVDPTIPEVLADFNFDADGSYFDGGNAKAAGTYTLVDHNGGKALKLDGNGQHLVVTDKKDKSLLTGVKEMTVSYQIKPENGKTNWGFFAAPNENQQQYQQEHYAGIVDISGTTSAERYNNSGARPATASAVTGYDGWYYVTAVYSERATTLYVNGKKVAEEASDYALSDILGENSILYIGKSTWESGEYATALIDNYKIVSRALTAEEVAEEAAKYVEAAPVQVDKTALKAAIDTKVDAKDTYTDASWKVYAEALAKADEVYKSDAATQAEVNAATKALTDAQAALEKKPEDPIVKELPYVDVAKGDWFYDGVYYNYFAGTMTGKDETHFAPLENLARAQFAVIIHRMKGEPKVEYKDTFPDVEANLWYTDAILWAASTGVVTGYTGTGLFGPADNINREQMAVMMYRYANYLKYDTSKKADFDKFEDAASVNEFAKEAMRWAVGTGIITGKYNGTQLDPQGNALRAECAIIIQRFEELYNK